MVFVPIAMAANWQRQSNIKSFLMSTTPSVQTHFLGKSDLQDLNTLWQPDTGKDSIECFSLGDLWDRFNKWSAYGAGVPICLVGGDDVVQYYAPSLSAIQIYTGKAPAPLRNGVEDSESECWSDDSEGEKLSRSWDGASEDSGFDPEASSPGKLGHLSFQFFENCSPYERIPLVEKVYDLAGNYPGLTTFKSVELSPASWMSIAWYPIYHIPSKSNLKELTTCFLTYHTISSSFQDHIYGSTPADLFGPPEGRNESKSDHQSSRLIPLSPFGLATYKMQGSLWINPENDDQERVDSLASAAESWLKQLRVHHHDFHFFTTHSM